jgi:ubiquinone/menaquinone biosynthesis methyltransferase
MFAGISRVYDRLNGLLSLGRDEAWRRNLARAIDPAAQDLLDVCCGTGELILAACDEGRGRRHVAMDFCLPMMREGHQAHGLGHRTLWAAADTQCLPLADASFDAVMVAFGLRNLGDLGLGLREIRRVLRPGGQILVLEFFRARRNWVQAPITAYLNAVVPFLGRRLSGDDDAYRYLPESMGRFLSVDEFCKALRDNGFGVDVDVRRQTFGIAHLVVARRP